MVYFYVFSQLHPPTSSLHSTRVCPHIPFSIFFPSFCLPSFSHIATFPPSDFLLSFKLPLSSFIPSSFLSAPEDLKTLGSLGTDRLQMYDSRQAACVNIGWCIIFNLCFKQTAAIYIKPVCSDLENDFTSTQFYHVSISVCTVDDLVSSFYWLFSVYRRYRSKLLLLCYCLSCFSIFRSYLWLFAVQTFRIKPLESGEIDTCQCLLSNIGMCTTSPGVLLNDDIKNGFPEETTFVTLPHPRVVLYFRNTAVL